jgi:hypothetical protein
MSVLPAQRTVTTNCPECGKKVSAVTCLSNPGQPMRTGDFTICIYCAGLLVFSDDQGNIRMADDAETAEFLQEDDNRALLRNVYRSVKRHACGVPACEGRRAV